MHNLGPVAAEVEVETSFVEHAYIEPEAGYARMIGGRIEIAACTQTPYMDRDEVAHVLGVSKSSVRIVPTATGGGFGGKLDISVQPLLAVAAMKLRRPVRMVYTRPESMVSTTKRHPARIRARASASPGRQAPDLRFFRRLQHRRLCELGTDGRQPRAGACDRPYLVPHVRALSARHPYQRSAGGRVSRLRRAAGGDRP